MIADRTDCGSPAVTRPNLPSAATSDRVTTSRARDPAGRHPHSLDQALGRVRHLLAHSNGLPPYYEFFDPHFAKDQARTAQELLPFVAVQAPAPSFEPGTRFEYSNLGFDVAALVIERVTGQDDEAFLDERLFSWLGMKNTFARPARLADWKGVRTLGYRRRDASWQTFDVFDMETFFGASGPNAFHGFVYWDLERGESVALVTNSTMPPWQTVTLQRNLVDALTARPVRADVQQAFTVFNRDIESLVTGTCVGDGIGIITVSARDALLTLRVDRGLELDMFRVSREVFSESTSGPQPGEDLTVELIDGNRALARRLSNG